MYPPGSQPPVSLDPVGSEAIRWVIDCAVRHGNRVTDLAPWTKALVAHMETGLADEVRQATLTRYPRLEYFSNEGTPHNRADEGFIEGGFAVSFPRAGQQAAR